MRFRHVVVLCAMALCTGCGQGPGIDRLTSTSVVLAFGDSLTAGTGVSNRDSYPSALSDLLGCPVVNAGVPGEDTNAGLRRLPGVLDRERPDLVILCHGGNDMLQKQDLQMTKSNLTEMVDLVKGRGADVVLIAVPKPGLLLRPPTLYEEVADEQGIPVEANSVSKILATRSLKSDQVHPNADGYRRLAESVAELIASSESD